MIFLWLKEPRESKIIDHMFTCVMLVYMLSRNTNPFFGLPRFKRIIWLQKNVSTFKLNTEHPVSYFESMIMISLELRKENFQKIYLNCWIRSKVSFESNCQSFRRALLWLVGQQQPDGSFQEEGAISHRIQVKWMSRVECTFIIAFACKNRIKLLDSPQIITAVSSKANPVSLTAFTVLGFLDNKRNLTSTIRNSMNKAIDYVALHWQVKLTRWFLNTEHLYNQPFPSYSHFLVHRTCSMAYPQHRYKDESNISGYNHDIFSSKP